MEEYAKSNPEIVIKFLKALEKADNFLELRVNGFIPSISTIP